MSPSFASTPERLVSFADGLVDAIRSVVGEGRAVPLHEPCFRGREWEYVKDSLDSGWVSTVGGYVSRFERQLADVTGCGWAVATSSGTAALHTCLLLSGVGPGDEVLVPSVSFVATANAVAYTGATPHFVDCNDVTLGIDPAALEAHLAGVAAIADGVCRNRWTGRRIAAIVPVHACGHPCQIEAIADIAARFHLTLVEDAAQALGSTYHGRHAGRWGRLSALSFNGNKTVTTGGGGAILTGDKALAELARHITTTAKLPHDWEYRHDRVGYNYRLPNLNAALGCAQLEQLPAFVESKRELARRYQHAFQGVEGVRFLSEPAGSRSNYWLCSVLLDEDRAGELATVLGRARDRGIMTRPSWHLLSDLPMYAECPRSPLAVSESIGRRLVNLPSSPGLCLAAAS